MAPFFPRTRADIDSIRMTVLDAGADVDSYHPSFRDQEYRQRRKVIVDGAQGYKYGQPIPRVHYTEEEKQTWRVVYEKLISLYPKHACDTFWNEVQAMQRDGVYTPDSVPQLEDVSNYLYKKTKFQLRPAGGLISDRDALGALAHRVFFTTQYLRHPSLPDYTPEPDSIHEVIGHIPMLANQEFADLSQQIGLCSIGASDEDIKKLACAYWFFAEAGLIKTPGGELKALGAAILSSASELVHATSCPVETKYLPWDPCDACNRPFPLTTFQPVYYVSSSIEEAKAKMYAYIKAIPRPFTAVYDRETETISISFYEDIQGEGARAHVSEVDRRAN